MKINFDMNIISELTKRDPKNLVERGLKLAEECGETAEAISGYSKVNGVEYKNAQSELVRYIPPSPMKGSGLCEGNNYIV